MSSRAEWIGKLNPQPRLVPADRWIVAEGFDGAGTTLTIQSVHRDIRHRPYVKVWIGGVLQRLPIDQRWGTGIVPLRTRGALEAMFSTTPEATDSVV